MSQTWPFHSSGTSFVLQSTTDRTPLLLPIQEHAKSIVLAVVVSLISDTQNYSLAVAQSYVCKKRPNLVANLKDYVPSQPTISVF
jgi:hypothetical protein